MPSLNSSSLNLLVESLNQAQRTFASLPASVDPRLRLRVQDGLRNLAGTVPAQCREAATPDVPVVPTTDSTTDSTTDTTTTDTTTDTVTTDTTTTAPTTTTTPTTPPPPVGGITPEGGTTTGTTP